MDNSLKIVYIAESFPSHSETWIHHEVKALQALGCEVRVYASRPSSEAAPTDPQGMRQVTVYPDNLPTTRVRDIVLVASSVIRNAKRDLVCDLHTFRQFFQVMRDLRIAARLLPQIRDFQPDFLFCHFAGSRANVCLFLYWAVDVPFGFLMHAADIWDRTALFRAKMKLARWKGVTSDYGLQFIRKTSPDVEWATTRLHSCGLPLDQWCLRRSPPHSSSVKLLSVGRLIPMKGFDVLIRAVASMPAETRPSVRIIGYGPEESRLQNLIQEHGVAHHISLLGYQPADAVQRWLLESDFFVLAALRDKQGSQDAVPTVLMEAMASGVPVISTRVAGIPELVEHGVSGLLCQPGDVSGLAEVIRQMMGLSHDARNAMVHQARRKVERDHDATVQAKRLLVQVNDALGLDFHPVTGHSAGPKS